MEVGSRNWLLWWLGGGRSELGGGLRDVEGGERETYARERENRMRERDDDGGYVDISLVGRQRRRGRTSVAVVGRREGRRSAQYPKKKSSATVKRGVRECAISEEEEERHNSVEKDEGHTQYLKGSVYTLEN